MNRVHIIGGKNHGKTTLVAELVQELAAQGLRVGTIKHTHHHHELDAPGKDSHRHRESGAAVVGILSRSMNAVFWPPEVDGESQRDDRYDSFGPMFAPCDLVLVEGDSRTAAPKIEVWRSALDAPPLAADDASIAAVVTDDDRELRELGLPVPVWSRSDVASVADAVLTIAGS